MKRDVKLLISLLFYACSKVKDWICLLGGRKPKGRFVILYYHAVPDELRGAFARQMDQVLKSAIPKGADWKGPVPRGKLHAAVTFDDGFESVAKNALPELSKRDIPCMLFIPSGYLGKAPGWAMAEDDPDRKERVMTGEQLRDIESDDVVMASHTVSHPRMTDLSPSDMRYQLEESKRTLEQELGHPITLFSFPHGACHPELIEMARETGYERVYSITPKLALLTDDEYVTGRVSIGLDDRPLEFFLKLNGMYSWLPALSALKRRLKGTPQPSDAVDQADNKTEIPLERMETKGTPHPSNAVDQADDKTEIPLERMGTKGAP